MDAMVHVTLQHLITYLLTAAVCFRKDGMVLLTIPNATSEKGFATLLADAKRCYSEQSDPTKPRFEWLCPLLVTDVFARLGFETQFVLPFGGSMSESRDLHIAATLTDLSQVQRFRNAIASHGLIHSGSIRSSTLTPISADVAVELGTAPINCYCGLLKGAAWVPEFMASTLLTCFLR